MVLELELVLELGIEFDLASKMRTSARLIWLMVCFGKEGVFKFDWGEITQRRMESDRVIKGLNVIKEHGLSLL
jgi:hypothetical protein